MSNGSRCDSITLLCCLWFEFVAGKKAPATTRVILACCTDSSSELFVVAVCRNCNRWCWCLIFHHSQWQRPSVKDLTWLLSSKCSRHTEWPYPFDLINTALKCMQQRALSLSEALLVTAKLLKKQQLFSLNSWLEELGYNAYCLDFLEQNIKLKTCTNYFS